MIPKNNYIDSKSSLELNFAPIHTSELDSKIKVEIPVDMRIVCPTNFDYNSKILANPMTVTCSSLDPLYTVITFHSPYVY